MRSFIRRYKFVLLFWACLFLAAAIMLSRHNGSMPRNSVTNSSGTDSATRSNAKAPPKMEPLPAPSQSDKAAEEADVANAITSADVHYLASRNLLIPVQGVAASQLRDTFNQARSEARRHDAIDISAPQGTPVLAASDGSVIKLFQSDKGGVTLYELDPSSRYVYYYAHLMRYADGIAEGTQLRRGDVIAYVGDTGNAGAGNYHLHFAISKPISPHGWSGGNPINPYPLLMRK
ncbi:MAG: endopeptidase [Blastocatellia bacterium AA13]|nr:MAG: endopeptidase [Blastocatellia bacterium AA13]